MAWDVAGDQSSRSVIRSSNVWRRPDAGARAELVWNENVPTLKTAETPTPPASLIHEHEEIVASQASETAPDDANAQMIARLREEALDDLAHELDARRAEALDDLARQRAESEQRIAETERLATSAIAQRREALERAWRSDEREVLAQRTDAALASHVAGLKQRYEDAEAQLREHVETRRRDETARLEEWRKQERERIAAELAAETERFNERLLRQLQEFEQQLGERSREQEERMARAWDEAEARTKQRLSALFDIAGA